MKYTNLRIAFLLLLVSFLSACASLEGLIEQESDGVSEAEQVVTQDTEQAVTVDPVTAQALLLKSQDNQYLLNKADVPSDIRTKFAQALALKQQKQYSRATEILLNITQSQANLSGPWLQLADISQLQAQDSQSKTDHYAQSKTYLQQAITVNPTNYFAHNRLGSLLRTEGDFTQAKNHYQLAIKSWPGFAPAYLNLAILDDLYIGDKHQALENYMLYQALIDKPERQVKGWIADLSRQIKAQQTEVLN